MSDFLVPYDGFDTPDGDAAHVIQGALVKFGTDAVWTSNSLPLDTGLHLIVMASCKILQCWRDKKPLDTLIETPKEPLPNVDELNNKIPVKEWELGLDGQPRPPWQLQRVLYLINPDDAAKYTFASGTIGAAIAIRNLKDRVHAMRHIRKQDVCPIVELSRAPMKTKYGMKQRPDFKIVDWCTFGGGGKQVAPQIEHGGGDSGMQKVAAPTLAEEMDDAIPWLGEPAKATATKK